MSAIFEVQNGQTKIIFEFIADTQKIIDTVKNAGRYYWNNGFGEHGTEESPIDYDSLTNQQKLDCIFDFVKSSILSKARYIHIKDASTDAVSTASTECETKFELN